MNDMPRLSRRAFIVGSAAIAGGIYLYFSQAEDAGTGTMAVGAALWWASARGGKRVGAV